MTNSEYWRMRMNAQSGSVYKRCDQFVAELMRQYQTAVRAMEADIAKWYQRFADANGITLAEAGRLLNSDELLEFRWTVEDYIQSGRENAVSGIWMKELESASARVHISRLDSLKMSLRQHVEELIGMQLKTLPEVLHATYRESYDRTVYELSRGSRVMLSYQKPDVRRIDRVLGTPWSSDGKEFSERVWNNRAQLIGSMNTHLTQSIIRGEDPQKAINAIAKDMNVSKRRAGTLVMTESAAIATAAQRDCYKDLDVEEFEYVCTLDEVTCPVCGAMDGKHFPMSKYEIGVNVPPMHPNCRCATAPYFDDMDDWGAERAARDENGKTVSVPAEMTYEQWKKEQKKADNAPVDKQLTGKSVPEKYQKRAETADNSENEVDNSRKSGIIKKKKSSSSIAPDKTGGTSVSFTEDKTTNDSDGRSNTDKPESTESTEKREPDFYVGPNGKVLLAKHKEWIGDNAMQEYMSKAQSEIARSYVRTDFRRSSFIGDGSTAAIREFERATGLNCGREGKDHHEKVTQLLNKINKSLKKELPESDRQMLEEMKKRLERSEE